MAGPIRLEKSKVNLDLVAHNLIQPEIRERLFDDALGMGDIYSILQHPYTALYGIMEKGRPEPVGVIFFTNAFPYRDCTLYAAVFDKKNRRRGLVQEVSERIKKDLQVNFASHSVTTYVVGKNEASEAILKKLGFEKIGIKPKGIYAGGKYQDLSIYYFLFPSKPAENKPQEE